MNREVIKLAQKAGFDPHDMSDDFTCNLIDIERFAELVAAAEREECAKACEELLSTGGSGDEHRDGVADCLAASMCSAIRSLTVGSTILSFSPAFS